MALSSFSPGLQPHPTKGVALNSNYIQFTDSSTSATFSDFAKQYLPELYEAEVERYGNRTIGGFLRMVGAEMPMSSDQIIWSEQNRLHIGYEDAVITSGTRITVTLSPNEELAIKVGNLMVVQGAAGELVVEVTAVQAGSGATRHFDVVPYTAADLTTTGTGGIFTNADKVSAFVFGSEYGKGSLLGPDTTLTPAFQQYNNKPMILRDDFEVNGSDAAQIGWVEVATEDGTSGYLWYLKAESETRLRFEDYMEMTMIESVKKNANGASTHEGSEGLFAAIKDRGQVYAAFSSAGTGTGATADFDAILKQLDKEGSIEENMIFCNRELALDFDDMLAQVNGGYAGTGANLGASFGLFNNESEMALNLGFSGFRRGSYDFYKSDWKYLNDAATRGVLGLNPNSPLAGLTGTVEGVMVPAGTSTVYDQIMGQNIRRPFLHVRYRASEAEDRRFKSWVTGSVGGAYTNAEDRMMVHFLSERCLCVQGANNFVLFTS